MKKIEDILEKFDKEFNVLEINANGVRHAINLSFIQKNLIKHFIASEISELLESIVPDNKKINKSKIYNADDRRYSYGFNECVKKTQERIKNVK